MPLIFPFCKETDGCLTYRKWLKYWFSSLFSQYFTQKKKKNNNSVNRFISSSAENHLYLRASVETGVSLIPLNTYLFSSRFLEPPASLMASVTKKSCSEFGWSKASSKYHTSMVGFPLTASEACVFAFEFSSGKYRSFLDYVCFNQITFPNDNCPRVSWTSLQSFCEGQSLPAFAVQKTVQFCCSWDAQQIIQSMLGWCSYTVIMFEVQTYKKLLFLQIVFGYIHLFWTLFLHRSLAASCNV